MRCLYCGKELALFKRLRGGEFCSDAHRQKYQEEYTQLALNRLLQANAPKDNEKGELEAQEDTLREGSPALKRRERTLRDEAAAEPPVPAPVATPVIAAPSPVSSAGPVRQTAVLEPEAVSAPKAEAAVAEVQVAEPENIEAAEEHLAPVEEVPLAQESPDDEPAPAPMAGFLVECPVPPPLDAAPPLDSCAPLAAVAALALPRLQPFQPDLDAVRLGPAEPVTLFLFAVTDFQTPPRERGLEQREFVRGVPQVEIHVKPAVESGFEPVKEPFEFTLAMFVPDEGPALWLAPEVELAAGADAGVQLGDLARLDFALTQWGGEVAEEIRTETAASIPTAEPPAAAPAEAAPPEVEAPPEPPGWSVRLEPMRLEPLKHEPAPLLSSRPEPVHFEPVHVDPVFMEKIAGTAAIEAPVEEPPVEPAPAPGNVTKPLPVTLHGLAPMRGKPVQVFTSAVVRMGEVQIPREPSLPLRPVMVLGPAPKPAVEPVHQPGPAAKSIPIPAKTEPRPDAKPRKAEVRVLPVQVKEVKPEPSKLAPAAPAKPEPREAAAKLKETPAPAKPLQPIKAEPVKPVEPVRPLEAVKPASPAKPAEPVKPAEAARSAAPPKPADAPKPAEPVKTAAQAKPAATQPAKPVEELDALGLPKLSFQQKETFWSQLPAVARLGVIAAVLALIIGGVVLTTRGSGSSKPVAVASNEPVMVEEPALGNTAGWAQDWFADRPGSPQSRHVDVLRGSLGLSDYRLLFEGQIEHGALGWVFRADNKSFYVEKIQVITPGHDPVVALEHFAVINGVEQQRSQAPIPIQAHLDTLYKVRMDVVGDKFTTWVQDEKIGTWTDSQIPVGGVGLYYDPGDSYKLRDTLNVVPLRKK